MARVAETQPLRRFAPQKASELKLGCLGLGARFKFSQPFLNHLDLLGHFKEHLVDLVLNSLVPQSWHRGMNAHQLESDVLTGLADLSDSSRRVHAGLLPRGLVKRQSRIRHQ